MQQGIKDRIPKEYSTLASGSLWFKPNMNEAKLIFYLFLFLFFFSLLQEIKRQFSWGKREAVERKVEDWTFLGPFGGGCVLNLSLLETGGH